MKAWEIKQLRLKIIQKLETVNNMDTLKELCIKVGMYHISTLHKTRGRLVDFLNKTDKQTIETVGTQLNLT